MVIGRSRVQILKKVIIPNWSESLLFSSGYVDEGNKCACELRKIRMHASWTLENFPHTKQLQKVEGQTNVGNFIECRFLKWLTRQLNSKFRLLYFCPTKNRSIFDNSQAISRNFLVQSSELLEMTSNAVSSKSYLEKKLAECLLFVSKNLEFSLEGILLQFNLSSQTDFDKFLTFFEIFQAKLRFFPFWLQNPKSKYCSRKHDKTGSGSLYRKIISPNFFDRNTIWPNTVWPNYFFR
jgi:hypothetical protein